MAKLHVATVSPSKPELIAGWLRSHPHLADHVDDDGLEVLGAYRFDDPACEVGIECHLLGGVDGAILHIPVTYRAEPIASWAEHLVGTLEHSVLGTRWVYDGCVDPVFVNELVRVMHTGGTQVELVVHTETGPVIREPNAEVRGTGSADSAPTVSTVSPHTHASGVTIETDGASVEVRRVLDLTDANAPAVALLGTWTNRTDAVTLATER